MDPIHTNLLEKAYNLYRNGQLSRASQLLVELIKHDPEHEKAWYLLSYVLKDLDRQIYAVQRVLKINPQNQTARIRLRKLSTLREDEDTGETPASGAVEDSPPEVTRHTEWIRDQQIADISFSPTQRLKFRARIFWRRFKMNWNIFSQSRLAVLGLILVIVFGLSTILIIQIRTIQKMGYSVVAFYTADTGIEKALEPILEYIKVENEGGEGNFPDNFGRNICLRTKLIIWT